MNLTKLELDQRRGRGAKEGEGATDGRSLRQGKRLGRLDETGLDAGEGRQRRVGMGWEEDRAVWRREKGREPEETEGGPGGEERMGGKEEGGGWGREDWTGV